MSDPEDKTIKLVIAADEPAIFFRSVREAELHLEAIDVREGIYTAAYGPNGEVYEIGASGDDVVIALTSQPNQPDALRAVLFRFLNAVNEPINPSDDLPVLIGRCKKFAYRRDNRVFGEGFPWLRVAITAGVLMLAMWFLLPSE